MSGLQPGGTEAVVHDIYRRALEGAGEVIGVGQRLRNPRPEAFVGAVRTGGNRMQRIIDQALITTCVWHPDEVEAERIARLLLDALHASTVIRPGGPRITRVQDLSFYYDPDPDSAVERYTFTAIVSVRAA